MTFAADKRPLKCGRVDEVFPLIRGTDEDNGSVPIAPLDLGSKSPVRIPILANCPQDLAGYGFSEVRVPS